MRKYNPYKNIFYYYRGPSHSKKDGQGDKQIEDNTTKALINTLENSDNRILRNFFKHLQISLKDSQNIRYDLQIAKEESRPDALIQVGTTQVFIESKIGCPLEKKQLLNHLKAIPKGYLVCITPRVGDKQVAKELNDKRVKFITWKDIYLFFRDSLKESKSKTTNFVISEFVNYLEAINMAPFYGWKKSHFEAFLNIEDDPNKVLMRQSKDNLNEYLNELKEQLVNVPLFNELKNKVGMLGPGDTRHCWGVLSIPPLEKIVHVPHFNFCLNADEFTVGVQIEGKKPARAFKKKVIKDRKACIKILKNLEGFDLTLRKRVNPDNRPRNYIGIPVARIALGDNVSEADIDFIIKKMGQYKLFEVNCTKSFKRDDSALENPSFLKESVKLMKQLEPYYRFSIS